MVGGGDDLQIDLTNLVLLSGELCAHLDVQDERAGNMEVATGP